MKTSRIIWSDSIEKMKIKSRIFMKLKSSDSIMKLKKRSMKFKRVTTGSKEPEKKEKLKLPGLLMTMQP